MERMGNAARYLASLPERSARAGAALVGGAVREGTAVALPDAVRRSRLYQATVDRLLRILVELVGEVPSAAPEALPAAELLKRKAAGNAVELASLVAAGFSPLWVLAAAADVIGGSRAYLKALVEQLQRASLLPDDADVASYDDLLARLETSSGLLADAVDVPPLALDDAKRSLQTLRAQADDLPSPADLAGLWTDLRETADRQGIGLAELSAALGAAAARAGWDIGDAHVFAFYRRSLDAIRRDGLPRYLRRAAAPYLRAAAGHLRPGRRTYTDRALDWFAARGGREASASRAAASAPPAD